MKTKKERTIIACGKQAERYRNPKVGDWFFYCRECYMCHIYHNPDNYDINCRGCPLAEQQEGLTIADFCCKQFKTYKNAQSILGEANNSYLRGASWVIYPNTLTKKVRKAFEARAKFYDWLAIELEKYPASQFTKKGWKDFELDKNL